MTSAEASLSPELYRRFTQIAYDSAGIAIRPGKETLVAARVARRMLALKLPTPEHYREFLESDQTGAELVLRPILLGGLFKAIGTPNVPLFEMPAPKRAHQAVELDRWAKRWGAPFRFASRFPMNTVKPLRMTLLAPSAARLALALALFRALWVEDRDISDAVVLGEIATEVGLDGSSLSAALDAPETKDLLRNATISAQDRGVFGVPTFLVGDQMFWGQDRVDWVRDALLGASPSM